MPHRLLSGTLVALVGAVGLWGCGGGGGTSATPTSPTASAPGAASGGATVIVSVIGNAGSGAYSPNPVKANTGDQVTFRNNNTELHHIVLDDGSADLGDVAPGALSRSFTVRSAAAVNFHCTIHPTMVGSINGLSAPEPKCIDNYGYEC